MRVSGSAVELSASDLSGFLSCIHLTALDMAVARGVREAPTWIDPVLIVLRERGLEHERGYVQKLRAEGLSATELDGIEAEDAVAKSVAAIEELALSHIVQEIQKLMGHKHISTTALYCDVSDEMLRNAVELV